MTNEQVTNEVHEAIKSIVVGNVSKDMDQGTADKVKIKVTEYLLSVSEAMGYMHIPVVKAEYDGMFLALNFLNDKEQRLETFGDLIYYMDTGKLQGENNEQ